MSKVRIKDAHSILSGSEDILEIGSGSFNLLNEEGQLLYQITLDGSVLTIAGGDVCSVKGKAFDSTFNIRPVASNMVRLHKNVLDIASCINRDQVTEEGQGDG